jgi:endonuclease III
LYARNMWEAQERYTNSSFFYAPLFKHLQLPKTLDSMKPESLANLLRSIGTLSYKDDSVRNLVKAGAERLQEDLTGLQTLFSTAVNIKDY